MHELVANLAEQNEVVICGSKLFTSTEVRFYTKTRKLFFDSLPLF